MGRQLTSGAEEVRVPQLKSVVQIICNAIFISAKVGFFFFFFSSFFFFLGGVEGGERIKNGKLERIVPHTKQEREILLLKARRDGLFLIIRDFLVLAQTPLC